MSGVDCIAIALLDVLSGLEELQICDAYEIDGKRTTDFPSHVEDLARAIPVYRTLPGWMTDISAVRKYEDFPAAAKRYIEAVADLVGIRSRSFRSAPTASKRCSARTERALPAAKRQRPRPEGLGQVFCRRLAGFRLFQADCRPRAMRVPPSWPVRRTGPE